MFEFWNPTVKKSESIRGSRLNSKSATNVKLKAETQMILSIMETKPNKNADNIDVDANNKATNQLPGTNAFATGTSTCMNPWARLFVPQQSTNYRNECENRGSTNPSLPGGNPTACSIANHPEICKLLKLDIINGVEAGLLVVHYEAVVQIAWSKGIDYKNYKKQL